MGFEKYTPEKIKEIEESRKKSDKSLISRGAEEKEGGRLEVTAKQEDKIRKEGYPDLHRKIDDLELNVEWEPEPNYLAAIYVDSENGKKLEPFRIGSDEGLNPSDVEKVFKAGVRRAREGADAKEVWYSLQYEIHPIRNKAYLKMLKKSKGI